MRPFSSPLRTSDNLMVGVAQLVEPQIVDLVVAGSSPVAHPIFRFEHQVVHNSLVWRALA